MHFNGLSVSESLRNGLGTTMAIELWQARHRQKFADGKVPKAIHGSAKMFLLRMTWVTLLHFFHQPKLTKKAINEIKVRRRPAPKTLSLTYSGNDFRKALPELPGSTSPVEMRNLLSCRARGELWNTD